MIELEHGSAGRTEQYLVHPTAGPCERKGLTLRDDLGQKTDPQKIPAKPSTPASALSSMLKINKSTDRGSQFDNKQRLAQYLLVTVLR
jgi:hypothetical protein